MLVTDEGYFRATVRGVNWTMVLGLRSSKDAQLVANRMNAVVELSERYSPATEEDEVERALSVLDEQPSKTSKKQEDQEAPATSKKKRANSGRADQIFARFQAKPDNKFSTADFMDMGMSKQEVGNRLSHLCKNRRITRTGRGVYRLEKV